MQITELYPQPGRAVPLKGLYLREPLLDLATRRRPLVYANFVASMDGRIAVVDEQGVSRIPKSLTSRRDWRLFQELQANAQCLITHGGYLRALQAGRLGDVLQVGVSSDARDLHNWRQQHGLRDQPAIVVASGSLEFELPESLSKHGQTVVIATGAQAKANRIRFWEARGYEVLIAGSGRWVEGRPLIEALKQRGYLSVYLIAGPGMLETMLRDQMLSRLYLTMSHQIVGGKKFHSLIGGTEFSAPAALELRSLYYGRGSADHAGEWFAMFQPKPDRRSRHRENDNEEAIVSA